MYVSFFYYYVRYLQKLSQFWYDDKTAVTLAKEALDGGSKRYVIVMSTTIITCDGHCHWLYGNVGEIELLGFPKNTLHSLLVVIYTSTEC